MNSNYPSKQELLREGYEQMLIEHEKVMGEFKKLDHESIKYVN